MRLVHLENSKNCLPLQRKKGKHHSKALNDAKIAQLVEHNLAKVGVAGSSPVFRSKRTFISEADAFCQG